MREKSCFLGQSTHTRDKNMTIAYPNCKNDETTKQFKQNGSDNNNKWKICDDDDDDRREQEEKQQQDIGTYTADLHHTVSHARLYTVHSRLSFSLTQSLSCDKIDVVRVC